MPTSACAIGLEERRTQQRTWSCGRASSQMKMTMLGFLCVCMLFIHEELARMIHERERREDMQQIMNPGRCIKDRALILAQPGEPLMSFLNVHPCKE